MVLVAHCFSLVEDYLSTFTKILGCTVSPILAYLPFNLLLLTFLLL